MFPFKTLTLYRVKKRFACPRSQDAFEVGQLLTYLKSALNHYEGVEICSFRDFHSGAVKNWHANEMMLEKWHEYFDVIPFPQ